MSKKVTYKPADRLLALNLAIEMAQEGLSEMTLLESKIRSLKKNQRRKDLTHTKQRKSA